MLYCPLMSVAVPVPVPFKMTLTPGKAPNASETVPVMKFCPIASMAQNRVSKTADNFEIDSVLIL